MDPEKSDEGSRQLEDVRAGQQVGDSFMPDSLSGMSEAELQKLGRRATLKMDLVILPILVIMYILNYLDRQNIASAKLADIEKDLNMSDVEYQTSVSILFCGYSTSVLPPSRRPTS